MGGLALWLFKYRSLALFILLESIGAWMTFSGVSYHRSRLNQFQIEIAGNYQYRIHRITRFMGLDEENIKLNQEITALKLQFSAKNGANDSIKGQIATSNQQGTLSPLQRNTFLWPDSGILLDFAAPARVVFCGLGNQQNYLLLDQGSLHGIQPRMAVLQGNKIAGQVQAVSEHFARVVPLIHTKMRTSALHPKSQTIASLVWDGFSTRYAELLDFPIHIPIKIGDSLVSSSYSAVYPPGLRLGRVDRVEIIPGAVTYKIRVVLATDYRQLDHVQVIRPALQSEREKILPQDLN
ncbi:MAG: rod shape-determining protein MreC [Sphingomonadales bacterium]|nr:rod shape-determining protein MreC [Sphingomonadales bacterium]